MQLTVLSPEKELYSGEIRSILLPGVEGKFQILKDHAPLVAALSPGKVEIKKGDGEEFSYMIDQGIIEVVDNKVALLVENANILE